MTDTTDIEALVAALRGKLIPYFHPTMAAHTKRMAICLSAADALERQQAVVEAAREVAKDYEDFPAMRRLRRELARFDRKKVHA